MKAAACFLILLLAAASAGARMDQEIALAPDARAEIKLGSCFDSVPPGGYAPIDVTINNHSGQARTWIFSFSSPGYTFGNMDNIGSTFQVTVENNGTRTAPLLVPTADSTRVGVALQVRVKGYGAQDGATLMVGGRPVSGKTMTPFVVISDSLGTALWSTLSSEMESDGVPLLGSTVNPDELPEDWRGLSGVAALWLSGGELDHLSAAQRQAVQTWVHTGGRLMLCGVTELPPDLRYAGFGRVIMLPAKLDMEATKAAIKELPQFYDGLSSDTVSSRQYATFDRVMPNVPLLSGFMGVFGLIVGPLNIFVLARNRRERLFWTTPLISLCASGLLMGIIVTQDGTGGHGTRSGVVFVFPQSRNAVIVQEQLSRTGMLLNSTFRMRDPVRIDQLDVAPEKAQGVGLRIDGDTYGEQWFASRSTQAQRIVAVTPTRAEITLLNAAEVEKGAPPAILSSFESTLETLVYMDDHHRTWQGSDIRTGQKKVLQMASDAAPKMHPPYGVADAIGSFLTSPGSFWATSEHTGDYVPTLDSVRWTDAPITYVGPVTTTP